MKTHRPEGRAGLFAFNGLLMRSLIVNRSHVGLIAWVKRRVWVRKRHHNKNLDLILASNQRVGSSNLSLGAPLYLRLGRGPSTRVIPPNGGAPFGNGYLNRRHL